MLYPEPVRRLMEELGKLPGIGPKTAQRLAFHLLESEPAAVEGLAQAMVEARRRVRHCSVCQNLTDTDPCPICRASERDPGLIMVVENPEDVVAMERIREYRGLYHVLGGVISPTEGIGPEELTIRELLGRINESVREVILATNPNVRGETTALYLAKLLAGTGVRVTRLARGLPAGGELDYLDELTLARALEGRREVE